MCYDWHMQGSIRAVVLSGGRMPRRLAERFPCEVKSLIQFQDKTLLSRSIEASLGLGQLVPPVAVVGPAEIRDEVRRFGNRARWLLEGETVIDNAMRGAKFFEWRYPLLLVSPDLPLVCSDDLEGFLAAVPPVAEMCVPVIRKQDFVAAFPGCPNRFNHAREGEVTMGSVFYTTGKALRKNIPLARDAFRARKYPWRLAYMLGFAIIAKYLLGIASIADVERRASRLLDCVARGIVVPFPRLAYDIDNELNLQYLEARKQGGQE